MAGRPQRAAERAAEPDGALGAARGAEQRPEAAYAELHAHTNFSLLDGTSSPEEMVQEAAIRKLRALAITDHDSLSGVVRFAAEARRHELPAIVGVELTLDAPPGARGGAPPGE